MHTIEVEVKEESEYECLADDKNRRHGPPCSVCPHSFLADNDLVTSNDDGKAIFTIKKLYGCRFVEWKVNGNVASVKKVEDERFLMCASARQLLRKMKELECAESPLRSAFEQLERAESAGKMTQIILSKQTICMLDEEVEPVRQEYKKQLYKTTALSAHLMMDYIIETDDA